MVSMLLLFACSLLACTAILGIEEAELVEGVGGQGGCLRAEDCDDNNRCTVDECNPATKQCSNQAVPDGPAPAELQVVGDCATVICSAGHPASETDDTDLPVDDNECTEDRCSDGTPSNPAEADGTPCTQYGGKICYQTQCVDCYNNTHCQLPLTCGGGGTPLTCGCTTDACDDVTCGWVADTKCNTGTVDCNDDLMNGYETDVDCGGPSVPNGGSCDTRCQPGDNCLVGTDCASNNCVDCGGFYQCDNCS